MTVDDLETYGMVRMDDERIAGFLASQSVGVLGLPAEGAPSLRPMSFGFDGESRLYLLYVLGGESRKRELTDRAGVARFLTYSAETPFNWRSVLLAGTIAEVPDGEREAALEAMDGAWRPSVFEAASEAQDTALYEFRIEERSGVEHLGLPSGLDAPDETE